MQLLGPVEPAPIRMPPQPEVRPRARLAEAAEGPVVTQPRLLERREGYEPVPGRGIQVIPYSRDLDICNVEQLAPGTGARYLSVIEGREGSLIAKAWRRKLPASLAPGEHIVDFQPDVPREQPAPAA